MTRSLFLATALVATMTGLGVSSARADLLVSSLNGVSRFDETTGAFIDGFVPLGSGGLNDPRGLIYGPDDNLYVVSRLTNSVLRYNGTTGAFLNAFVPSGSGGLNDPRALAFGTSGDLYVGSFATNSVLRYEGATGTFLGAFVPSGSGGLTQPRGITFGPDGNLYIAAGNNNILRYDGITGAPLPALGETGAVFVPAGSGGSTLPISLTFGPDGSLYVSDRPNDQILRYAATTGAFLDAFVPTGSGGLDDPNGLVFGPDGNLYVNSSVTNSVVRYDGVTGAPLPVLGQAGATFVPTGSGGLNVPAFLTFTPTAVPEPSTLTLLGMGALGLLGCGWRQRKRAKHCS